jgi:hypothetical protein
MEESKNRKIEMVFQKNEKIKTSFSDWADVKIQETKKFYRVIVDEGSLFESLFKTIPEFVTSRSFANNYNPKK